MLLRICKEYDIDIASWYAEWAQKLHHRRGIMVSLKGLGSAIRNNYDPGYSSIYVFNKEDAELLRSSGSSRGMNQFAVGAWAIPIDIDNGDKQLAEVERILQAKQFEYFVYCSGGKGYHVYIPQTRFLYDHTLPYTHKVFISDIFSDVDFSLYQHGRLLSLTRRIHPKTKVRKHFVKRVPGNRVELTLVSPPTPTFNLDITENKDFSTALIGIADAYNTPPNIGGRHTTLWGVAMDLAQVGVERGLAEGLLCHLNDLWPEPKEHKEVIEAIRQAYMRCSE